jgi:hypothetical protein
MMLDEMASKGCHPDEVSHMTLVSAYAGLCHGLPLEDVLLKIYMSI